MKKLIVIFIALTSLQAISQTTTDQINTLLKRKADLERTIIKSQSEIKRIDAQIEALKNATSTSVQFVTEINGKIIATTGANGAILRESPAATATEVVKIAPNTTFYIHRERQGVYAKATYSGKEGWVNYNSIKKDAEIDELFGKKKAVPVQQTVKVVRVKADDPKFKRLEKIYGAEKAVHIINKEMWKGMSHGMVKEALGKPIKKTQENTAKGLKEVWTYADRTITFVNGSLISW